MALIKALTDEAGIRIGALHDIATLLFEQSGRQSWAAFERSILVIELASKRADFINEGHIPQFDQIGIVVPCGRIVSELREQLLEDAEESEQGTLRFSPTIVRGGAS